MPNYNPSTIGRIADIHAGIRVETSVFANLTYFHQDQWEIFKIYGRIWVRQLFIEAITDNGAGATQLLFNCTFTTPVIAVNSICAKCASIAAMVRGVRVVWLGGAVLTAAVITDGAGVSDVLPDAGQILGGEGFIGTIGMLTSDADAASGTSKAVIFYVPLSDGAYVEANL
jgi:hypothetical protein